MTAGRRPLAAPRTIFNLGIGGFADAAAVAGGAVVEIDWRPPADGDREAGRRLAGLIADPAVEAANETAFARYLAAEPALTGVGKARDVVPGMEPRMLLHAGPPIAWEEMCGPMRGAATGAVLLEGWAADPDAARALLAGGGVRFAPCHHHDAVGPMAGIVSPSMPIWIVENGAGGNRAFAGFNEGLGKALRFGAFDAAVRDRLRWMRDRLAAILRRTLERHGPLPLKPLIAQALHMGDEVHNRNAAATAILVKRLLPSALRIGAAADDLAEAFEFIAGNDHFFINISMAAAKAMLDAASGVPHASLVTAMARNGAAFGIRTSGTGARWFTAEAPVVDGLYFPGYSRADAARDIGDSAITETAGLGGFAMAAAPAIARFVGGRPADALAATRTMRRITIGENPAFTIPILDFAPVPAGIDARRVVDTGLQPVVNTGIAHREPGVGQIGAGITHAPLACFAKAVSALYLDLRRVSGSRAAGRSAG